MPDQLEQSLREAFSDRAAQVDPASVARLRAIDYHPREHRSRKLPTLGAIGAAGTAGIVGAIVALGSSAAPAFGGWQAAPSSPAPGQLAQAAQECSQHSGSPVLSDSRGPYTASIYESATTSDVCLSGSGVSMSNSMPVATGTVPAGQIQVNGGGTQDSAGNALTMVDGRTAAGVSAVTIERSDGSTVQATVAGGWYLAWWPGTVAAKDAKVTTPSGTDTVAFPPTHGLPPLPTCPAGARCSGGYSFGGGPGKHGAMKSSTVHVGGSAATGATTPE